MNIETPNIEQYFEISDLGELIEALPNGITGKSKTARRRYRLLLEKCIIDNFTLTQGHAGKIFKLCLAYQWDEGDWKPSPEGIEQALDTADWKEAYRDAYENDE